MNIYQQVFYRLRDDAGWAGIESISGQRPYQQQFPSIACDIRGRCHAVWCSKGGTEHMQLAYAQRDTDGVWSSPMILTALDSGNVTHPSIACDSGIHVVWYDASSGNEDVYYLRGSLPGSGFAESPASIPHSPFTLPDVRPTVARGVLVSPRSHAALLDAAGRRVMALRPGANDVHGLAAGVYYVVAPREARPDPVAIIR
jgi:hypothetical protein